MIGDDHQESYGVTVLVLPFCSVFTGASKMEWPVYTGTNFKGAWLVGYKHVTLGTSSPAPGKKVD
jgi:hypothetical protein